AVVPAPAAVGDGVRRVRDRAAASVPRRPACSTRRRHRPRAAHRIRAAVSVDLVEPSLPRQQARRRPGPAGVRSDLRVPRRIGDQPVRPGRVVRRVVTIPLGLCWHLLVLCTLPMTVPVAGLVSLAVRSSRPIRTLAFLGAYSSLELVTLARILTLRSRYPGEVQTAEAEAAWQGLVQWLLHSAAVAIRRTLDVGVALEPGSCERDELRRSEGVIVLARHCGPGDTLLIAWLLVAHYRLRLLVVLKSLLRIIPAIDLAG